MFKQHPFLSVLVASLLLAFGLSLGEARAQATRTWVSGVGDDANPCSRTAPCKTFAGAISKTAASGEINCLDPGGFGAVTITKSLAIICDGVVGGVLVSGTNGIVVNAGISDLVHLSGLDIEGIGTGLSGVDILQALQVRIANTTIRGFTVAGVNIAPNGASGGVKVDVIDSLIADNGGSGILNKPTGGASVRTVINRTRVLKNSGDGVLANGTGTTGNLSVAVRDSESSHNVTGFGAFSGGVNTFLMIDASTAFDNTTGVAANGTGAVVRFTRLAVTGNGTGVLQIGSGQALSYGTNSVAGNVVDGIFGTTPQN